jgi:hypothetical protein
MQHLRQSLSALRQKLESILAAESFSARDLAVATLCFGPDPAQNDDHCSICRATLKMADEDAVEYVVNYLGQTLDAQPCVAADAPQSAHR